jgi:hypothetical protein
VKWGLCDSTPFFHDSPDVARSTICFLDLPPKMLQQNDGALMVSFADLIINGREFSGRDNGICQIKSELLHITAGPSMITLFGVSKYP